ncbi:MAG: formylglycine-generating enzyme family protein, partial [Chloroflexi bacterium]
VGSYPDGASPYGLLDMSGNVWEWTSSLEHSYPYAADDGREEVEADGKRIARGGSYYYTQYQLRCVTRSGFAPTTANRQFGFRVALSLQSGSED